MDRRSFITGLAGAIAAPAIVRAGSLMPVRVQLQVVKDAMLFYRRGFANEFAPYERYFFFDGRLVNLVTSGTWDGWPTGYMREDLVVVDPK